MVSWWACEWEVNVWLDREREQLSSELILADIWPKYNTKYAAVEFGCRDWDTDTVGDGWSRARASCVDELLVSHILLITIINIIVTGSQVQGVSELICDQYESISVPSRFESN